MDWGSELPNLSNSILSAPPIALFFIITNIRDALMINSECLGLYDIPPPQYSLEFAQLLNDPELSDFVIEPADGPEIHVHQVILMARWPHFRNIHKSGMIEATQRHLQIPEPHAVVLALLRYFYSDCLDDAEPWEIVADVLVLANMYILTRLKKICCERLYRRHLTVDTCGHIFERAIFAQEPGLKALVLDFMFANYGAVLKSNVLIAMSSQAKDEFLEAVPQEAVLEVSKGRAAAVISAAVTTAQVVNHSQTSSPASSAESAAAQAAAAAAASNPSSNTTASSGGFVSLSRNVTGGSLPMSSGGMDLSGMNGMSVGV
jgi:BTB/POZ domain